MMPTDSEERSAVAAEYVIGSLPADEMPDFEQALASDTALQREVYFWQDRLLPMTRMLAPEEPSALLWRRIERSVRTGTKRDDRWWESLTFWRTGALAASLVAVMLAVRLLWPAVGPEPARYVAVLQSPDRKDAGWIVEATAGGQLRLSPLGTTTVEPQKVLQFWTKAKNAAGPTSLGLVRPDRATVLNAAVLPTLEQEQLFELTLEPAGGSPIGRPTGPILYVGRAVAVSSF